MKIKLKLFAAFQDYEPEGQIELELADGARVADLRLALDGYGQRHWPKYRPGLLKYSAFASETTLLRDRDSIPVDGRMAVLPPVNGGLPWKRCNVPWWTFSRND